MPTVSNSLYFEQRARECLDSAKHAASSSIAKVHRNFARKYREAAMQAEAEEAGDRTAGPVDRTRGSAGEACHGG